MLGNLPIAIDMDIASAGEASCAAGGLSGKTTDVTFMGAS